MIEGEILRRDAGKRRRLACRRLRKLSRVANSQELPTLLYIQRPLANRADKSVAERLPVKHLSGVERKREIKIGRRDFHLRVPYRHPERSRGIPSLYGKLICGERGKRR